MNERINTSRNMITVNNVFAQWIRKIEVKRYEDNLQVVLTSAIYIYKYLDTFFLSEFSLSNIIV